MHSLVDKYQLKGQFRWIAAQTDRARNGELYRCVADTRDGVSGFHIDPSNGDESSDKIASFFEKCYTDIECWTTVRTKG
ncbi:unnamed protein product [Cochlearia groenlandica]